MTAAPLRLPARVAAAADRQLHDQVAGHLGELPHSANQIAVLLGQAQVRGIRGAGLGHPLARWLAHVLGEGHVAWLCGGSVRVVCPPTAGALVPLPQAAASFARGFDDGIYPQLELDLETPLEQAPLADAAPPDLDCCAGPVDAGPPASRPLAPDDTVVIPIHNAQMEGQR